jgi:hypothetical protein
MAFPLSKQLHINPLTAEQKGGNSGGNSNVYRVIIAGVTREFPLKVTLCYPQKTITIKLSYPHSIDNAFK